MNQREKDALDRHITGNYGEDQIGDEEMDEQVELNKMVKKFDHISTLAIDCRNAVMGLVGDLQLQQLVADLELAVTEVADVILERE